VRSGDMIDHYRLERDLGAGAFATVWLATDLYLDDHVAIKILADNWARHDEVRRRFIDEAKIMRRIDHPLTVRVFAVDELPTGQPMFVMTYADRATLADRIHDRRQRGEQFHPDEVAALMLDLAQCLTVIHDFGIVHRDLKPSNVLFRSLRRQESEQARNGEIMLLGDFGLAKDTIAHSGFTQAAGTPAYRAPEQARTNFGLDHRADIYSATAIMFELLTGAPPGDPSTVHRRDLHRLDLQAGWQELIDIGLAVEPTARFRSAAELSAAVQRLLLIHPGRADTRARPSASAPSPVAATESDPVAGGLCERVDDILRGFTAQRAASVDRRLRELPTVALVGEPDELAEAAKIVGQLAVQTVPLAATDVRIGAVDAIVLAPSVDRMQLRIALDECPAGPVAVTTFADPNWQRELAHVMHIVTQRSDTIRASAALAQLDDDVRRSGSVAMSESWMHIRDAVDAMRFEVPAIGDLDVVRALVRDVASDLAHGGTLRSPRDSEFLPRARRQALLALLFDLDLARRLHAPPTASPDDLRRSAAEQLDEWREYQNSGRMPFAARTAVARAIHALELIVAGSSRQ
jgi:tRNA A-37 threonylcarbamoyl transferase component Bud32